MNLDSDTGWQRANDERETRELKGTLNDGSPFVLSMSIDTYRNRQDRRCGFQGKIDGVWVYWSDNKTRKMCTSAARAFAKLRLNWWLKKFGG